MTDSPSRKQDQFIVRFPDGMREAVKERAAKDGRSMNAQIIHALDFYFLYGPEEGKDANQSIHGMDTTSRAILKDIQKRLIALENRFERK
jgi:hypothetical protein